VYQPPANIGPFILEGSKPGAAAASCWLSHKLIRPDRSGYGQICRASVLAARELYERLVHWEQSCRANKVRTAYRFVPITAPPPDTNIVCFIVCEKEHRSLVRANALTRAVYERFTIQAELGERDYAYSQPFFLSRTRFHLPNYSERAVAELLERAALDSAEYPAAGIFVLRATLMNPYLSLAAETGHKQSLLGEFVEWLAEVTTEVLPQVDSLTIASCVPVPSPVSS
jgi:glutamate/tyrosine decarboxylase-like PLP-dependent enzyme